jgi:hypothetical protein
MVGGLLDVKTEKMSRPASVAAERSNETPMDEEAEGGAMGAATAAHSPGSEARPGSSPVREAAVSRPSVSEEPLNIAMAAEASVAQVEKEHTGEEKGETADKQLGAGGGICSPEPPLEGRRSAGSSLKEEGNGEGDLAEDFSDFGDSDEDILNQEDEKGESRPVSRISGKSSRSAKEEVVVGGETTAAKKEETDASKVRDRRKESE